MERSVRMRLGVVIERREIDNRWQKWRWTPLAVIPGAPKVEAWKELRRGEGWVQFHAATLTLELHRKETEAYRYNLSGRQPAIYVGLRKQSGGEHELAPFLVTASPYEAQSYTEFGDDLVEAVVMPEALIAWVQDFIDRHHVDQPHYKRKRKRWDGDEAGPGASAGSERRGG